MASSAVRRRQRIQHNVRRIDSRHSRLSIRSDHPPQTVAVAGQKVAHGQAIAGGSTSSSSVAGGSPVFTRGSLLVPRGNQDVARSLVRAALPILAAFLCGRSVLNRLSGIGIWNGQQASYPKDCSLFFHRGVRTGNASLGAPDSARIHCSPEQILGQALRRSPLLGTFLLIIAMAENHSAITVCKERLCWGVCCCLASLRTLRR